MEVTQKQVMALIKQFSGQANVLVTPRIFVEFTKDHISALLLNQIIYWSERTHDKEGWFYKSGDDWMEELALSRYQVNRAVNQLKAVGVEVKLKKANGAPTLHYRLNNEVFSNSFFKFLENGNSTNFKMENEETRKSDFEVSLNSLTEITTEITPKTTSSSPRELPAMPIKRPPPQDKEPPTENRKIAAYFAKAINTHEDALSSMDYQAINSLVAAGFTLERCQPGIDETVSGIRSRPGGVVRSFRVCEKSIRQLDPANQPISVKPYQGQGQGQSVPFPTDDDDMARWRAERKKQLARIMTQAPVQVGA